MEDYYMWLRRRNRRAIRRERIFRDRTHPLEVYNDAQVYRSFRFPRHIIFNLAEEIAGEIEFPVRRRGSLTPVLQICLTLRFYATGAFQTVVSDLIGVDRATASRTISRVTDALYGHVREWISLPGQDEADRQKRKFYAMRGFPNVVGCLDGTHIRIQAPAGGHENDFVNRKNFHSLNVQLSTGKKYEQIGSADVICDADMMFTNVVARWPGSVHDARILRTSPLFAAFEGNQPPLDGILLGDSGYMLRTWLMTPILNPVPAAERRHNFAHCSTRSTIERSIGVAKQRWHCLRCGLRLEPQKASRIIQVCFMLANRARHLNLPPPPNDEDNEEKEEGDAGDVNYNGPNNMNERARTAAGQRVRARIIAANFAQGRRA